MGVSALNTGGWICDPMGAIPRIILVQDAIVGVVQSPVVLVGVVTTPGTISGTIDAAPALVGIVVPGDAINGTLSPIVLVGTLSCDGVTMTDITMTRGDSRNISLEVNDSGGADVDLTGAVIKFAAKCDIDEANEDAVIFKTSYSSDEIEVTNAVQGEAVIKLLVDDTNIDAPNTYQFAVEVTRQGSVVHNSGAVSTATGSGDLTFSSPLPTAVKVGDIVLLTNAVNPENQKPITVVAVAGSVVTTDYTGWLTETGRTFEVHRGIRDTVAKGTLTLEADIVL
jgi:hypothetical protein